MIAARATKKRGRGEMEGEMQKKGPSNVMRDFMAAPTLFLFCGPPSLHTNQIGLTDAHISRIKRKG